MRVAFCFYRFLLLSRSQSAGIFTGSIVDRYVDFIVGNINVINLFVKRRIGEYNKQVK
jgi:hypothetical protein